MKILIVEDEPSLREVMKRTLVREGYVVETAGTFAEADDKLAAYAYDCILLDIMLPDSNGLNLLERIKSEGKRENVIIISARGAMEDKVAGLDLGADDYLPKPFHMMELSACIRSVARRSQNGGQRGFTQGNVYLDPERGVVQVNGVTLELLKKEFDILLYFLQRPGHTIDKAVLAEAVWGDHVDQADDFSFVYAQISNLRRKLEKAGAPVELRSLYNFGNKMVVIEP